MPELDLTQSEADALIVMPKIRCDNIAYDYPTPGSKLTLTLTCRAKREVFILDITRGRIDLRKGTYQNRAKQVIPLVRVDFGGPPHTNPDGEMIQTPHIHIYREGFADKWASPIPADFCLDPSDAWQLLQGFYIRCAIVEPPIITRGLFT